MPDGSTHSKEELTQKHLEMQERFETLQPTNARLVKDLKKKKESYVRREVFYKSQISNIKEVLEKTVLCRGGNESSMPSIRSMHSQASALFFASSQATGNERWTCTRHDDPTDLVMRQVMANIEEMQARRDRTVEEHEKNLLRQFRSNIIEVEDRLKKEQSKEDDVAGVPRAWIERTAQLSKDVDQHKEQVRAVAVLWPCPVCARRDWVCWLTENLRLFGT